MLDTYHKWNSNIAVFHIPNSINKSGWMRSKRAILNKNLYKLFF